MSERHQRVPVLDYRIAHLAILGGGFRSRCRRLQRWRPVASQSTWSMNCTCFCWTRSRWPDRIVVLADAVRTWQCRAFCLEQYI